MTRMAVSPRSILILRSLANQAAGAKDVTVAGGPNVVRLLLRAGLVDELRMGIMLILLGKGLGLFENLQGLQNAPTGRRDKAPTASSAHAEYINPEGCRPSGANWLLSPEAARDAGVTST